jgi:tRNA G18 (ribose-2'-O)-methylase SpoU
MGSYRFMISEKIPILPIKKSSSYDSFINGVEYGKYQIEKNKGIMRRGYFGIGIEEGKYDINYGTLFRTAQIMGADFCFIIGDNCRKMVTDTMHSYNNMPVFRYIDSNDFLNHLPIGVKLISIEMGEDAVKLSEFKHPKNAVYVLGNEKEGVSKSIINKSHAMVKLNGENSMNVAVAGSIVIYDRVNRK